MTARRLAFFAYLVGIHALLAVVVLKSDFRHRVSEAVGLTVPGARFVATDTRILQQRVDPNVPRGATIFLGDSHTAGLAVAAVSERAVNFGIGQLTTGQLANSIGGYKSLDRAGAVFLAIGTNDIGTGKQDWQQDFETILRHVPVATPLIWSGIFPQGEPQAEIVQVNRLIEATCSRRPGCTFVDTVAVLSGPNGAARPGLLADGVHLSPAGYALWIDALR